MRRVVFAVLLAIPLISLASGDILQQLGVKRDDASTAVVEAFADGGVNYSLVERPFKAATPALRATMVEQVLVWTKGYVSSPQFGKQYVAWRERQKPQKPDDLPTADEELAKIDAERKAHLDELKKSIAMFPAEHRAVAEEAYRAAVAAYKDSDTPQQRQMMRRMFQEGRDAEQNANQLRYEQAVRNWSDKHPPTHEGLIKLRLREFLATTANVDFDAKLVTSSGIRRFADPEYEKKPWEWKLAFRTGREPTERARAFAQAWLNELR
jgi:hypothetical protein